MGKLSKNYFQHRMIIVLFSCKFFEFENRIYHIISYRYFFLNNTLSHIFKFSKRVRVYRNYLHTIFFASSREKHVRFAPCPENDSVKSIF